MKTQIKTKDLLKILDPRSGDIFYKNEKVIIDFTELKKYVTEPKTYNIFETTDSHQTNLYKNAALYIINHSKEKSKYIEVNLDDANPVIHGLFEYIKCIYNKEEYVGISLPETGNNLLLIKSKKLISSEELMEKAKDIELGQLQNLITPNGNIIQSNHVVKNEQFFWKQSSADNYNNPDFILEKIKKLCEKGFSGHYAQDRQKALFELFSKVSPSIVNDVEFKLSLLELKNKDLLKLIFKKAKNDEVTQSLPSYDFTDNAYQDKIYHDIEKNDFFLFEILFEKHLDNVESTRYYKSSFDTEKIDFSRFFHHPNTVRYLQEQNIYNNDNDKFNTLTSYQYLSEEDKLDAIILDKYLKGIESNRSYNSEGKYDNDSLMKVPLKKFNEKEFLLQTISSLELKQFAQMFKKNKASNGLLAQHNTLFDSPKSFRLEQIIYLLDNNYKAADITKDLILHLIEKKTDLYGYLCRHSKNKAVTKYLSDIDVIYHAYVHNSKVSNESGYIAQALLVDSDKEEIKEFQLYYVFDNKLLSYHTKYAKPEEAQKFNDKYYKPEYLFIGKDQYAYDNKKRDSTLRKIKDKNEVLAILDKIQNIDFHCVFHANHFYNALHAPFKSDIEIVQQIIKKGKLDFNNLHESLQYNKNLALDFIRSDFKNVSHVPQQFFNDTQFCIEFAGIVDEQHNWNSSVMPVFISKFFENQEITENWQQYLNTYISMNKLENNLGSEKSQIRRNKL